MSLQSYVNIDSPDPVNAPDLATKNYVDTKPFFTTAGITAPGSIAANATTQITAWGNALQVVRGAGTWSAGVYTVGLAGIYRVKFQLYWSFSTAFTTDASYGEMIQRNGAELARSSIYIVTLTTGVGMAHSVDRTYAYGVGDTITFWAFAGATAESLYLNNANTFMEIAYLQP